MATMAIRSLFLTYDTDGNDKLDKEELGKLFERDWAWQLKGQAEAYSTFLDLDGCQTVSFNELQQWLSIGEKFKNINDKTR